jgi:L-alanine-DL-glutamate epimerase-like enolase superfamily enzyme
MLINFILLVNYDFDLEAHKAVRKAVGDDFKLMSDPVAPYTFEQALRFGRELEKLNYYWYEEPLFDENFHNSKRIDKNSRYTNSRNRSFSKASL